MSLGGRFRKKKRSPLSTKEGGSQKNGLSGTLDKKRKKCLFKRSQTISLSGLRHEDLGGGESHAWSKGEREHQVRKGPGWKCD